MIIQLHMNDQGLLMEFIMGLEKGMGATVFRKTLKFARAKQCWINIATNKAVTETLVMGLLDSVGGFFSATILAHEKGIVSIDAVATAKELMELAGRIHLQYYKDPDGFEKYCKLHLVKS